MAFGLGTGVRILIREVIGHLCGLRSTALSLVSTCDDFVLDALNRYLLPTSNYT